MATYKRKDEIEATQYFSSVRIDKMRELEGGGRTAFIIDFCSSDFLN